MNNEKDIMDSFQMKWWESLSLDEQKEWLKIFSENLKLELNIKRKPTPKEISPKTKEDIERWHQGNIDMQIEKQIENNIDTQIKYTQRWRQGNINMQIEDKFDEYEYSEGC